MVRGPEPIRILSNVPSVVSSLRRSLSHQQGDDGWRQPDQNVAGGLFHRDSNDSDGLFQHDRNEALLRLSQQNSIMMEICVSVESSCEILSTNEGLEEEEEETGN